MADRPSIERRLLQLLGGIAIVALGGVLAILPYRLYARDIRNAEVNAHRIASLVHVALSVALESGADVTDLVNRFQGIADLEIRLTRLGEGEVHPGEARGRGSSRLDGTDLTYTAPPILARDGGTWIAIMHFDLSPMKRESVRLIIDLLLAVAIGSALFSVAVFLLIRRSLLAPLRDMTRQVERYAAGDALAPLPEFESRELASLAAALERARSVHPATS
jgi:methyl-accepting chemotaxis protein